MIDSLVLSSNRAMTDRHRRRRWFEPRAVCVAAAVAVMGSAGCGGSDANIVRLPTVTNHVIRVQGDGAGSGSVTTPDASPQLVCTITSGALSGICAMAYPPNSAVRLVATPNVGSSFTGWGGACAGTDQCVVDMSNERTVTAAFAPR